MFCQKCGAKVIEGASFCRECGAQLKKDEPIKSAPVEFSNPNAAPESTGPVPQNQQSVDATEISTLEAAYERLTAAAATYPKLKRIKIRKSLNAANVWLSALGTLNTYTYSQNKKTGKLDISWSIRTGIEVAQLIILVCILSFLAFLEANEFLMSAVLLLNVFFCICISLLCYKESTEISAYIGRTLNYGFDRPSKMPIIVTCAWNLGITIFILWDMFSLV